MKPLTSSPLINDAARHLEAADDMPSYADDPAACRDGFFNSADRATLLEGVEWIAVTSIPGHHRAAISTMTRLQLAAVLRIMLDLAETDSSADLFRDMCDCIGWYLP